MTHVNAFKQDVKDALAEAHKALSEAEEKFESLLTKLEADAQPEQPAVSEPTSEVPAGVPGSLPEEPTPPAPKKK